MSRLLLTAFLLGMLASAAFAQAPIERLPPTPSPLSVWPQPAALPTRSSLLVSTFDGAVHPCLLRNLGPARLICMGPHHRAIEVFDREQIAIIAFAPKGYLLSNTFETLALGAGLLSLGIGGSCSVDGGPVCRTPAVIGLSLLATGGVLEIVKHHRRHHQAQLVYVADPPPSPDPAYPAAP